MHVLYESQPERLRVQSFTDDGGNRRDAGGLRRSPSTLACNELPRLVHTPNDYGLKLTITLHRLTELVQSILIECSARIPRVCCNFVHGQCQLLAEPGLSYLSTRLLPSFIARDDRPTRSQNPTGHNGPSPNAGVEQHGR
jgi:hypothetical protein